ncbi:ankyrin repeat-containing domain protein, partial [Pyronema domesticum]
LHIAVYYGVQDVSQALIDNPLVDISAEFRPGASPLLLATIGNQTDIVLQLLKSHNVRVDLTCLHRENPLSIAACNRNSNIALRLLNHSYNDGKCPVYAGSLALLHAAQNGHTNLLNLLLEKTDINLGVKDGFGVSASAKASEEGHEEIVRSLLLHDDKSLDNLSNNHGNTGLLLSAENGYTRILHLLLNRQNANHNRQNNDGDTALIRAAIKGNSDIVNILLQHVDTDVNLKNKRAKRP